MLPSFVSAFILGLVGGVIPGPVLTATFTEILQNGFWKSMRIILWAMFTETAVALVSLIALDALHLSEATFRGLSFIGAAILIWIALSLWNIRSIDTEQKVHFSLGKISAMILANGMLWTYWITVCVPQAVLLGTQVTFGAYLFLLLVEVGWLVSTVGVALLFSSVRKFLSHPRVIPAIFKLFSLAFFFFAVNMIYTSAVFFMER
jgi:threonine/homoserine/homoserine lactone efflux protein